MTLYLAWLRGHDRRPYPVILGAEPHLGGYDARHIIGKPIPLPDSFADRTVDEAVEYAELSLGVTAP